MKRTFLFLLLIAAVTMISAAPSLYTSSGIMHTIGALTNEQRLSFALHLDGFTKDFHVTYVTSAGDTEMAWDTYAGGDLNFGLAYSFTRWLEVGAAGNAMVDAIDTPEAPGRVNENASFGSYGLGDTKVFAKLNTAGLFGATDNADIGVYGFYSINTGDLFDSSMSTSSLASVDFFKNTGGIFRYFTTGSRDYGVVGIVSFKTQTQVPIEINLNGGYTKSNQNRNTSEANFLNYAGSFSVQFGSFVPFVEVFGMKYMGNSFYGGDLYNFACGGVRFDTPVGLVIDLGADYRITRFTPDVTPVADEMNPLYRINTGWGGAPEWKAYFGLSYYYDFKKEAPVIKVVEKKTIITGKIIDAMSGLPLSATITLPGYSDNISIVSDTTGIYQIEVNPGTIRIRADREGYKWQEKGIIIEKGQTKIMDFALNEKVVEKGIVTGKVSDKSSGEKVIAKISFPGTEIPEITVDQTTGVYRIEVAPGTYTMASVADGYIAFAQPIVIEAGKTLIMNIEMLKKGGKINLRGIKFESGKATIMPESYYVLDEAVKMLKDNPKVRIEVQGHTDSVGSASSNMSLSQSRAEAVRIYLIQHGIEAERIVAKGMGESQPIADNGTKEGQAQNRRIEFLIIGD